MSPGCVQRPCSGATGVAPLYHDQHLYQHPTPHRERDAEVTDTGLHEDEGTSQLSGKPGQPYPVEGRQQHTPSHCDAQGTRLPEQLAWDVGVLQLCVMETAGVGAEGVSWVSTQVTLGTSIGLK